MTAVTTCADSEPVVGEVELVRVVSDSGHIMPRYESPLNELRASRAGRAAEDCKPQANAPCAPLALL